MNKKKDFTLLIQGAFSSNAIQSCGNNPRVFTDIVYSTWPKDGPMANCEVPLTNDETVRFIKTELPDVTNKYNAANLYYQVVSTLEGLKQVKTKYVLKHRSDESYSNLHLVLEQFERNPTKLLCSNVFFRPLSYAPYHISDHFFLGETKTLVTAFTHLRDYLIATADMLEILGNRYSPEQLIALFYLVAASKQELTITGLIAKKNDKKYVYGIMEQYFDVFDIKHLMPYTVKHNHLKTTIHDLKKANKQSLVAYVSRIEDIKKVSIWGVVKPYLRKVKRLIGL